MGDHLIKVGFEREEVDVNNLFAQNSEGSYVFDSLTTAECDGIWFALQQRGDQQRK